MNIDWENITAKDLYVLFNSFINSGASSSGSKEKIQKVEIYPSEFGMKEMEKLKKQGPNELFSEPNSDAEANSDTETHKKFKAKQAARRAAAANSITDMDEVLAEEAFGNEDGFIDQKKLRKFELKKLKFYYAIATFDSKETAFKIYSQCDGMEIEKTQNFLDLRFVPDSLTEFPYAPKETFAIKANKSLINYAPDFTENRALQHSKVKLTWDTNDKKRDKMLQRAFTKEGFNRDDINELLVSSDSEEDEDLVGFKHLLLQNAEKEQENEMQLLKRKKNKEFKIKEGETFEVNFNKGFEGVNVSDKVLNSTKNDRSLYNEYLERKKNIRREKKTEERKAKETKKIKRNNNDYDNNDNDSNRHAFNEEYNDDRLNDKALENKKHMNKNISSSNSNNFEKSSKKELSLLVDESLKDVKFKFNPSDDRFKAVGRDNKYAVDPTAKEYKNVRNSKKH